MSDNKLDFPNETGLEMILKYFSISFVGGYIARQMDDSFWLGFIVVSLITIWCYWFLWAMNIIMLRNERKAKDRWVVRAENLFFPFWIHKLFKTQLYRNLKIVQDKYEQEKQKEKNKT